MVNLLKLNRFLLNSCVASVLVGLVYYLFYYHPVLYAYLVAEDSWGANASFCF